MLLIPLFLLIPYPSLGTVSKCRTCKRNQAYINSIWFLLGRERQVPVDSCCIYLNKVRMLLRDLSRVHPLLADDPTYVHPDLEMSIDLRSEA